MKQHSQVHRQMPSNIRWVKARRKILQQVKSWVDRHLGPEPSDIRKYSQNYRQLFRFEWNPSSSNELVEAVLDSDIVFGSDFHAFSQAQRTHLRILRALPRSKKVVLCLEAFESRHQAYLDRYLKGEMSEEKFLEMIRWEKNWGFPWENYKPLLQLAIQRKIRVVALNRFFHYRTGATLRRRDEHAAGLISRVIKSNPKALVYVVFGELHLGPQHLPAEVQKRVKRKHLRSITILQNEERLYFRLAEHGLENSVHVLRKNSLFCVLTSPPWVKWQSYLLFLEGSLDSDLYGEEGLDLTEHVRELVRILLSDLGLKLKSTDLAIYNSGDRGLWVALDRALTSPQMKLAESLIMAGQSFFVPQGGVGCLNQPTVNHAAMLAGEYIHSRLSHRTLLLWDLPKDFEALVWVEMWAFFLSKLINPRRKPESFRDLRVHSPRQSREVMLIALDHKVSAIFLKHRQPTPLKVRQRRFQPRQKSSYLFAARLLGSLFGDRMYAAYSSGYIQKRDVLKWLSLSVTKKDFARTYEDVIRRLEAMPQWIKEIDRTL